LRQIHWIAIIFFCWGLAACAPGDPARQYQLRYRFFDQGNYRVEAKYTFTDRLVKAHQGKAFLEKTDIVNVAAAFRLSTEPTSESGIRARYHLVNISIHDNAGHFSLELSPQNGEITWFGTSEGFEDYFTTEEFERYQELVSRPLAIVTIDAQGVQQNQTAPQGSQLNFNHELIQLLGKNRAIGKIVVKTIKIPPVLMTILSEEAVWVGRQWTYQGVAAPQVVAWDHPLTTVFKLKSDLDRGLVIVFNSEMEFSGDELTQLGKQMGITEFEKINFQESRFKVEGEVLFDSQQGRPREGSMFIEKKYGLQTGEENWKLVEQQDYQFSLSPIIE